MGGSHILLSYGVTASTGGSNPLSLGSNPSGITLMPCSIMVITADSKSVAFWGRQSGFES